MTKTCPKLLRQYCTVSFIIIAIFISYCIFVYNFADAANSPGFSQIIFSFPNQREYTYSINKQENAVLIEIANTAPHELGAVDYFDESLIRRIVVKDFSPKGTEVKFILKNRDVRVSVNEFNEPFRIVVDFFKKDFSQTRDPITGMPFTNNETAEKTKQTPNVVLDTPQDREVEQPTSEKATLLIKPESEDANEGEGEYKKLVSDTPRTEGSRPADKETSPAEKNAEPESPQKRRLLQPSPEMVQDPNQLRGVLLSVEPGTGKFWKEYPIYVYRIQTAAYQDENSQDAWLKQNADQAMSSNAAMADYAGKLFDFGHENRALLAYEQVLFRDPRLFDKRALDLWKFAECHLGQGNLTLAEGYFEQLSQKHPANALARFADLRRLDIAAIRMMRKGDVDGLKKLAPELNKILARDNQELQAQLHIRATYWREHTAEVADQLQNDRYYLPILKSDPFNSLLSILNNVEAQKTAFLGASLLLNAMAEPTAAWQKGYGEFAGVYFKRYSGPATEPIRTTLSDKLKDKLNNTIITKVTEGKLLEAIQTFENLPPSLQSIRKTRATSWSLAEAYRRLGQIEKSIKFYEDAAAQSTEGVDRFRALFWLAIGAGGLRNDLRDSAQSAAQMSALGDKSRTADSQMLDTWQALKAKEQQDLLVGLREPIEKNIQASVILKTPPVMLLSAYTQTLATKMDASTNTPEDWKKNYSPSGKSALLLSNLAKRFGELGMNKDRQTAINLLKFMKPKDFSDEESAKKLWAEELSKLADEYRESSRYLEAGELYAYAGAESENWEKRASTLYKGGLLLYRSGRREEALKVFTQCSEDGNDRYYANLCSERLFRLNNN